MLLLLLSTAALNNTLKMACVAHALCVICLAKYNPGGISSSASGTLPALLLLLLPIALLVFLELLDCHLKRKIKP